MTLEDRLRLHLADKGAAWRSEAHITFAVWDEAGPCALALPPQPLSAASLVDAYLARPPGARLTVVHEGAVSPTARRSAERFGIVLLDAATLPPLAEPAPLPPEVLAELLAADVPPLRELPISAPARIRAHEPPAWASFEVAPELAALLTDGLPHAPELPEPDFAVALALDAPLWTPPPEPALDVALALDAPLWTPPPEPALHVALALAAPLWTPPPEPALDVALALDAPLWTPPFEPEPVGAAPLAPALLAPAKPEAADAVPAPAEAVPPADAETPTPLPQMPLPEPAVAPVAAASVWIEAPAEPLLEEIPGLPWDPRAPLAEASVAVDVSASELAALPWHAHAPIEEHVEILEGSPRPRRHAQRPTVVGAPNWGLPWTRQAPTPEALSIADPRIWNARERVHAVREDLDAAVGAASFGAVKPEGSAWIRRIQTYGPA